jgi:hypothetical protein
MSHYTERDQARVLPGCARTRLAEGALAAVDICDCGIFQLQLGALTLRLEPSALSDLAETLQQALIAQARRRAPATAPGLLATRQPERGEA